MRARFRPVFTIILAFFCLCAPTASAEEEDYIKWVEFGIPYRALEEAMTLDMETHGGARHLGWVEMLSHLAAKYGGDFSKYKSRDMKKLADALTSPETEDDPATDGKLYKYYLKAYGAVLDGLLGTHKIQGDDGAWVEKYGLKGFSPIAAGFAFSHYDDFGTGRNYGYRRRHLGHDMFGSIGTPIIAVESGIVEAMGWNQYGGWRVGIRSLDGRRYHYYAHLRQNRPFHESLAEGSLVKAGDVIGYMGHTGYSTSENVNNIQQVHLHYGLQLIFHESQKECDSEIWIDVYNLVRLLQNNRSAVYRVAETKEFYRQHDFDEESLHAPPA